MPSDAHKLPLPVEVLLADTFADAFTGLYACTKPLTELEPKFGAGWARAVLACADDTSSGWMGHLAEHLDDLGFVEAAVAWSMLAARPEDPRAYHSFMPNLATYVAALDGNHNLMDLEKAQRRMLTWWDCAAGRYSSYTRTTFDAVMDDAPRHRAVTGLQRVRERLEPDVMDLLEDEPDGPSLVVMKVQPGAKLTAENTVYKALVQRPLQLDVVVDAAALRAQLVSEFPHAAAAVALLTRDLRTGEPVRMKPSLVVGPPGSGKSMLTRRLVELLGVGVTRYSGAGASDGLFGGSARTWSTSMPCVPARAVLASRRGNPLVLLDEVDKSGSGSHNGNFWSALMPFLERETAARHMDLSLEAELDLSWVSYVATANEDTLLPSPLRDRFRVVRMPAPTLAYLPALAAQVVAALAHEAGEQAEFHPDLEPDELAVIGKAWAARGLSMRQLQKIVSATLDARAAHAMRH